MAKGRKGSVVAKEDDAVSKTSKNAVREEDSAASSSDNVEEVTSEVLDILETKSVAESDSGRHCGDLLSALVATKAKETEYDEPSLSDIIVDHYEGERSSTGQFEGHGEAAFIGGNTYKGFFSGGVMHGKGKYTWGDGLQYDGDMNNNQISGYGRYEWSDKSYYEGEVSNGLRHGVGVFKSPKYNVSYSGQWYLGKRHGRGIMHYNEHSWYEGDWVNNSRHGWGIRRYHTGNVYEGQWVNDKRHGQGTMRWLTTDESFSGMWENGVQHGCGTHTWYLNRVPGSQYPLRNEYVGDFVNGLRHGHGKFFFASGAVYDGEWENNKKHGWGKFIFKNGRVFEGQFENDHMVDYPSFQLDGNENLDTSSIRTRTPVGWDEGEADMSKDGSGNLLGPSLTLDIDSILDEFKEDEREKELKQVTFLMIRNVSVLRRVYSFYSALGHDRSPDNTFVMTRFQFWRFLKDCQVHHHNQSLSAMDRAMAKCHAGSGDVHNPMEKLLLREFLTNCVVLSYLIYKQEEKYDTSKKTTVLSRCLQRLIDEHILKHSCRVGGQFLSEPRRAVNALAYMDRSWHIYQRVCTPRQQPPYEPTFRMRQFLFLLKDLKIIGPHLSTRAVLSILAADDPSVSDGDTCNLEVEMTFLEFFEALIGIAVNFISHDMLQRSFGVSDTQPDRISRPASSVTQSVSEHATNPIYSMDSFSQMEEERADGKEQTSKQSLLSNTGVGSTGGFLQTLSQMSIQDDETQLPEENASVTHDDTPATQNPRTETEIGSPRENEFNIWCSKLNKFFIDHLFPAWSHMESLRSAVAKTKAEMEEQKRLMTIEMEAQRRRLTQPEEVKPTVTEETDQPVEAAVPSEECGSAGNEYQAIEVNEVARVASSASAVSSIKSGKLKKKK